MPIATAHDGAPLHYRVHDYSDPWKKAPTIVLLHGFGRSSRFWYSLVPYLSRFFRVVCPDLRGLGESLPLTNALETLTAANLLRDVSTVADHAGADRFHLVGESLTGTTNIIYAAENPHRVKSLTLLAPGVWVGAGTWTSKAYALDYPSWEEALRALGVEEWVRCSNTLARFPAESDPAFLEWYTKEVGRTQLDSAIAIVRIAATLDARPYLSRISVPVLALYPGASGISSPEQREMLRASIPNVRIKTLGTSHQMLAMLRPAEVGHEILQFSALHEGLVARE